MTEKSSEKNQSPEFRQIIGNYSDEELRKVLKKRNLYQKEAADFAVSEAIKRGLIFSEQDLFAREFQHEPEKFALFPAVENSNARTKFRKSIARLLIIVGLLPMVWGGSIIFKTQSIEGVALFLFGATWSIISYQLMRLVNAKLVIALFFMLGLVIAYFVRIFISAGFVKLIDVAFVAIAIGFIAYGIGFLGRLKD